MHAALKDKIFSSLHLSKEHLLQEMAILLTKQQLSEYRMEIEYFEKKYGKKFHEFEAVFQNESSSYEMENDWMSWKFAVESHSYWENILFQATP